MKENNESLSNVDISTEFDDIFNKVRTQVVETQEEFIFQTLSNFALNNCNVVVKKDELVEAIQLIRMMKKEGFDPQKLSGYMDAYHSGYARGYLEGIRDEKKRTELMRETLGGIVND